MSAQVPFDRAIADLSSPDAGVRFRAAQLLKASAYPESAIPLAAAVADPQDEVQFEAIAAELNVFLAGKIVPRKRVGFVVEVRNKIVAEAAFSLGPLAIGSRPVPAEVLTALRTAVRDDNPRVGLEALYTFGTLAVEPGGSARRDLLHSAGPDLAALIGAQDPAMRLAAIRVIGRLFEKRPQDDAVDPSAGDAVISAMNENDRVFKSAAMEALGAMRYERGVQALTDLFEFYGRGEMAAASLDALARIAYPGSAPLFEAQLTNKNATLKGIAVEGLARVGDRNKLAAIEAALAGERNESVLLAGTFASALLAHAPLDQVVESMNRPRLRDQARHYLIEAAAGRSQQFLRYAQDPEGRLRTDIADVLGLAGDPAALPVVEPLMKDQDPQVAFAAQRAVARLRVATKRRT